jgi:Fe-S cluster biogenesis protein NfuA
LTNADNRVGTDADNSVADYDMRERVEGVLERVRSHLRGDGANIELLGIAEGVVTIKLTGGCMRCPMSQIALVTGLENALKEVVSDVQKVVIVRA